MAKSLIAHTVKSGTSGGTTTTNAIDTTGATLLLVVTVSNQISEGLTDSKSNTWFKIYYGPTAAGGANMHLFVSIPTTVGSGHTFTSTIGTLTAIAVQAWSGVAPIGAAVATAGATTVATASVAAVGATSLPGLFVAIFGSTVATGTISVGSSFTISDSAIGVGSQSFGIGMAYKESSSAETPTWTQSSGQCIAGLMFFGILGTTGAGGSYGFA